MLMLTLAVLKYTKFVGYLRGQRVEGFERDKG